MPLQPPAAPLATESPAASATNTRVQPRGPMARFGASASSDLSPGSHIESGTRTVHYTDATAVNQSKFAASSLTRASWHHDKPAAASGASNFSSWKSVQQSPPLQTVFLTFLDPCNHSKARVAVSRRLRRRLRFPPQQNRLRAQTTPIIK